MATDGTGEIVRPSGAEGPTPPGAEPAASVAPERPDVFITYSRVDESFMWRLHAALAARGKDAWVDREDIRKGEEWWKRIQRGIESAAAVVAVLSPEFVSSEVCHDEVRHAAANNKRFVPILLRAVDTKALPTELSSIDWLDFDHDDDFDARVDELVKVLESDFDWLDRHARLNDRAHEWERSARDASFLLQRNDLTGAERWLDKQGQHDERATALQTEYILASRRASSRRLQKTLAAVAVALGVAIALGVVALILRSQSIAREHDALSRELAANAVTQLGVDPELSLILALRAADHAHTEQAELALRLALAGSHVRSTVDVRPTRPLNATFSPTGRDLLVLARNGVASAIDVRTGRTRMLSGRRAIRDLLGGPESERGTAFAPDASVGAVVNVDGSVTAWRPGTWKRLATWPGRFVEVHFPKRPQVAVTIDDRLHAELRRFPSGEVVKSLGGGDDISVVTAEIAPDGRAIAGSEAGGAGERWDVRLWIGPRWRSVLLKNQDAPHFSPDGRLLVTSTREGGGMTVWDARTGKPAHAFGARCDCGFGRFVSGGRLLASDADGTAAIVYDTRTWKPLHTVSGDDGDAVIATSADMRLLVRAHDQGAPSLWDVEAGRRIAVLRGHRGRILAATVTNGGRVVTVSSDGTMRRWRPDGWSSVQSVGGDVGAAAAAGDAIVAVVSHTLGSDPSKWDSALWRATLSEDGRIVDARLWERLADTVIFPALSRDGAYAALTERGNLGIWALNGGKPRQLRLLEGRSAAAFSPDGRFLTTGSDESPTVDVFAVRPWRHAGSLPDASKPPIDPDLAVASDGSVAFVSPFDADARVWELASGKALVNLGNLPAVYEANFSADGGRLVVGPEDEPLRIHDARTGSVLTELVGHASQAATAEFSPDGKLVLTGAYDGTVRIWDAASGQEITTLYAPKSALSGARFDRDGRIVLAWGEGSIRAHVCDVCGDYDELRERASRRVTRELTSSEHRLYGV